jgi:rod shape-determining protein MreB
VNSVDCWWAAGGNVPCPSRGRQAFTHWACLAIDLGTANTCVYAKGKGVILNEPSLIAFNAVSGVVEAVGTAAREMLGRSPSHLRPVRPIKDGVIADFDATEKMLAHFIRKTHQMVRAWFRPRVLVGVPTEITPVERRAVKDSAYRAKASEVYLVDEPMAAAVGAGLPIADAAGNMIRHRRRHRRHRRHLARRRRDRPLGAGRRRRDGRCDHPLLEEAPRSAGRRADRRSDQDRDRVGDAAGRAAVDGSERAAPEQGRAGEGHGHRRRNSRGDRRAVAGDSSRDSRNPGPDSAGASDIYDRGVALCGGGSLLRNFDKRIRDETQLPVQMVDDPLSCVVVGAGKMLSDDTLLKKLSIQ